MSKIICIFTVIFFVIRIAYGDVKIGEKAPNIILRDNNNNLIISTNILKQKPILISFFYTDCKPCIKEIPELEKLNKKYKNRVEFFLICTDTNGVDAVKPFIDQMNLSIKVLIDKYSDVAKSYHVTKYPSSFIINKKGKIIFFCFGYKQENIKKMETKLKKLKKGL